MWIEELEYICKDKADTMYSLISELDKIPTNSLVIGTTNSIDKVDKAVRRGGRLDIDIRLDMPSDNDRFEVFK